MRDEKRYAFRRLTATAALALLALPLALTAGCSRGGERPPLVPDGYASWRRTTDVTLNYPIPGHMENLRVIYMNDVGFGFGRSAAGVEFPAGTVIAKEVYAGPNPPAGAAPTMVTAMVKAPDDPDARGGWLWVMKDLSTGAETVVGGNFCVTCHGNANEGHPYGDRNAGEEFRDYVFFVPGSGAVPSPDGY